MSQRAKRCQCGGMIRVFKTVTYPEVDGVTKYQRVRCAGCNKTGSQITKEQIIWDSSDKWTINNQQIAGQANK